MDTDSQETHQVISGDISAVAETVSLGRAVREGLLEEVTSGLRPDQQKRVNHE